MIPSGSVHDFHLSRCEINYETSTGDLQIAAHIFIDDLEQAMIKDGGNKLYLSTNRESQEAENDIEKYIRKHLRIKANGKSIKFDLLGKETTKDMIAVWCYLEATGLKNLTSVEIENKILTELYNDQKNIVDFKVDKKKKFFAIFDAKKISDTIFL
jgi:hypothetical protein